jgi:hypothetical protein
MTVTSGEVAAARVIPVGDGGHQRAAGLCDIIRRLHQEGRGTEAGELTQSLWSEASAAARILTQIAGDVSDQNRALTSRTSEGRAES